MPSPKLHVIRISIFSVALSVVACAYKPQTPPTIDGSSDAAFIASRAKLMKALSPEDRIRLVLAEVVLLAPKGCISMEPIPRQPELTQVLGGQANIVNCRDELDGMTFPAIIKAAEDSSNAVEVSVIDAPHN